MKRQVSLDEISDGRLYELNDMVKAGCNDCIGCSDCCGGMGNSIILDPLDCHRLVLNLKITFEELLVNRIELNVVEGIILPNLKMTMSSEKCSFLDEKGRCSIHEFRPGICRIFPLGRYYENQSFKYFLQVRECSRENKTKVKVKKWIDTPELKNYEQFITEWHYFLEAVEECIKKSQDEKTVKEINLYILKSFYLTSYDSQVDFYEEFSRRLQVARAFCLKDQK